MCLYIFSLLKKQVQTFLYLAILIQFTSHLWRAFSGIELYCGVFYLEDHTGDGQKIHEGIEQTSQLKCYEKTYMTWQELRWILKVVVGKKKSIITLKVTQASLNFSEKWLLLSTCWTTVVADGSWWASRPSPEGNRRPGYLWYGKGWGTQQLFSITPHWYGLQPCQPSRREHRQGLREWRTAHCRRRSGSRPIICENLWQSSEVPSDWKRGNLTSVFKKGKKEDLRNYRPVSLNSVPSNVIEQIHLETILSKRKRRLLVTASVASLRADGAWQIWWPSMMRLLRWWIREEQLIPSTRTCAKHFTPSCMTRLSLNWRHMDLMDGPLGG